MTEVGLKIWIGYIRSEVPGIRLRTTMIVGYPSESRENFDELKDFIERMQFDRLGCFMYSQEDATTAFPLGEPCYCKGENRKDFVN